MHVGLAERRAHCGGSGRRRRHGDVAVRQAGEHHEPVEAVVLAGLSPHDAGLVEDLPQVGSVDIGDCVAMQAEVVDPERSGTVGRDLVGPFVGDVGTQVLENRQHVGA